MEEQKKKMDILDWLCVLLIALMLIIVTAQIVSRYVFNNVFIWSDEMAKFLLIYLTLFGMVVAERNGSNIRFDFLVERLPMVPKLIVNIFVNLLIAAFHIFMIVYGVKLAQQAHFMQAVTIPFIRWSYIYAALPVTFGIMLIMHIKQSMASAKATLGLKTKEEKEA